MNVTIIGTGNMARGIGTRLVTGGNSVTLVSREAEAEAAATLSAQLAGAVAQGATVQTAAYGSRLEDEIVILAVPYSAAFDIVREYGPQLAGKIVVDITNPLNATYDGLATPPGSSAAEEIARIVPAGTHVLKAFNTTFAGTLVAGQVAGQPLDVFVAGDDAAAKQALVGLIEAGKLRAIDVGPLSRARQLEGMALLGITLQFSLGTQFMTAWKLLQ